MDNELKNSCWLGLQFSQATIVLHLILSDCPFYTYYIDTGAMPPSGWLVFYSVCVATHPQQVNVKKVYLILVLMWLETQSN